MLPEMQLPNSPPPAPQLEAGVDGAVDNSPVGRVDELERGLGLALGDYRRNAEQVLLKHLEALERAESAHQLEVANLRAENGMLRQQLGVVNVQDPGLFQSVMLAPNPQERKNSDGGKNSSNKRDKKVANRSNTRNFGGKSSDDEKDRDRLLSVRKAKDAANQKPGGAWQQFVAWVPNGAALKASEPWKPLPQMPQLPGLPPGQALPSSAQPSNQLQLSKGDTINNLTSVVPGSVADDVDNETNSSSSSQVKQQEFEVLDVWKASKKDLDKLRKVRDSADGESRYTRDQSVGSADTEEQVFEIEATPHGLIIHPHSPQRIGWDVFGLFMVVYDMVMIPMFVFSIPEDFFLQFMQWVTRVFWTIDMGWSICTGVVMADGQVEFSFKYILNRYLRTWFPLDILIVGFDWVMLAFEAESNKVGELTKLTRALRSVRVVRLLRLVRMQEFVASISERIHSDKLSFLLSICKLSVFVLAVSHWTGCSWWGIGIRETDEPTWVKQTSYGTANLATQYLVSLHWALTQFTGGMDEIVPASAIERFFSVTVWVCKFLAASIIISVLTSNLTQLHIIGGTQSRQLATLRKYLNQNHVSSNISLRVVRSAQHAVSGDLTQDTVELLAVVSEPLKVEMHFNMYGCVLRWHPFFCDYIGEGAQVMRRVCHYAMSTLLLAAGDVVFSRGEMLPEPKMYIVWRGTCEYVCGYGLGTPVTEKHWVSEANLWTRWKHRGTLTATGDIKLAQLDAKAFQEIVRRYKDVHAFDPKLYAADFVAHMNQADELDDLTSLCSR